MKVRIIVFALVAAAMLLSSSGVSYAWWMNNAQIVEVQRFSSQANLVVNNGGANFTAAIALDNENQIIAMALTALSLNSTVHLSIVSGEIVGLRILSD